MPIKHAAFKHVRQTTKRTAVNRTVKSDFRDAIKTARKLITEKKAADAKIAVAKATKLLDKAARKRVITKNTAARKKSRLMLALAKVK